MSFFWQEKTKNQNNKTENKQKTKSQLVPDFHREAENHYSYLEWVSGHFWSHTDNKDATSPKSGPLLQYLSCLPVEYHQ